MNNMNLTPIPQNYKNNVEWILGAYTDAGITFPNGFQKDAIQNAVGARKTNKWKNWRCDISLVKNEKGQYIIVEDSGTVGLTGKIIPISEIDKLMAQGSVLGPDERLSRFTSMFNSGGNTTGGGLFGAGKSVYSVASQSYTYYYDSLREDGVYVANVNRCGQVLPDSLTNEDAKKFIRDKTGLSEKKSTGTRIIIEKPREDLIDSIQNETIIPFIQESWWRIIERLKDGAAISVNGKEVLVPKEMKNDATHHCELQNAETYADGYRVKHFGLYVFDNGNNRWSGISYYRKGMKIGDIDLKDIPKKIDGKFWGYVEVDEQWEDELSEIEDRVHFGVSRGKKNTKTFQNLKNYCNRKVKANLEEWGYIKNKETEDKKLQNEMQEIANDLQSLFEKLGFESLGKEPKKGDFSIRWQHVVYPKLGSEEVTTDDKIRFSILINSSYAADKKFDYKIAVVDPSTGNEVSKIDENEIIVASNDRERIDSVFVVKPNNSVQYAENRIVFFVKVKGSGKSVKKELSFFYDIDKPDTSRPHVGLALHECIFPWKNSRRVNFGEMLHDVSYSIENKRGLELKYRLNISIHNASVPTCDKIVDIASLTGIVQPYEQCISDPIKDILFDQNVYEQYLTSGILELRARLIAVEDSGEIEKGDKITSYNYKIYLNCDEKNGFQDSFSVRSVDAPDDYRRSWCETGNGRSITLNVGHPAYLYVSDYPEVQHEYIREQMLKQYVMLYLEEGRYDMFNVSGQIFTELEPQEAAEQVLNKMESVYSKSLR